MGRMRGLLCFLILLGCPVLPGAPPRLPSRLIKIPVWVESKEGAAFTPKDFRATLEGSSSRILGVKGPGDDLMVLVVLDLTEDLALVEPAKDALIAEIQNMPPRTDVALLRAQDGLKVLLDPTADRAAITGAIQNLPVSGKAGLLDTLEPTERVADAILTKTSVRVAVLYVTDSDIHNYREDFTNPVINSSDIHDLSRRFPEQLIQEKISKLAAALSDRQTPLFIVHLRYRSERLNEAYQNGLKQLAELTGGQSNFCRSSAEIPEAMHRSFELICSHYSVTLALPDRARKNVQVQLDAGGNRSLSYRTRFVLKER